MRKIMLIALVAISSCINAQSSYSITPTDRTINVTGSASLEIVPDEIYLQVDLKEYEKKGKEKVDIEQIRKNFLEGCKSVGIPDTCVTIYNYEGLNASQWQLYKKKRSEDLKASISYWIKLDSPEKVDKLISKLDDDATANFFIAQVSHSKIIEFRKQLKIQAIKAAKEKAKYLAEAIDEKVGKAITINEPNDGSDYSASRDNYRLSANTYFANSLINGSSQADDDTNKTDFKKIKLRFEISVVFALQ